MKVYIKLIKLFPLFFILFPFFVNAQIQNITPSAQNEEILQETVEDIKTQAEVVKKKAEIQEKALEIEKKDAELKLQEAEIAKKEEAIVHETTKSKLKLKAAAETVKKKEEEAQAAVAKVKSSEEILESSQETVRLLEEVLNLEQKKVDKVEAEAEREIKKRKKMFYSRLLYTGVIILTGYLLIFFLVSVINRRIKDLKVKHVMRKNVTYSVNFLILVMIVFLWLQNLSSIAIIFSVIGAGVALALQEAILCIAGWFLLIARKPFDVGDRIEFGGIKGDVIDIRLFQISLLEIGNWVEADQSTGRIVNIPNSAIFKKENYNYTSGFEFIWNEIKILVTFESDLIVAEKIILKYANEHSEEMEDKVRRKINRMSRKYMIHYEKFRPIVYIKIKDSGVELSLRYLTDAKQRRTTEDALSRKILCDFSKEDKVNFAYTTYRIVK